MAVATCVIDLREQARCRVPRMFYDYVDGGSWSESTYRANATAFDKCFLRQRVCIDMSVRNLATTLIGQPVSMPVAVTPTGLAGMIHADGEILAQRAAEAAGIPFTLSTVSICSIEEVARHATKPFWFQLYVMRDRAFARQLIDRARAAGCSALMLTLDLQIHGQRNKDIKNGLTTPPRIGPRNVLDFLSKPKWCMGMLGTRNRTFGNIVGHAEGVTDLGTLAAWTASSMDPSLSWDGVKWVRDVWQGPLILKGILDPEDAERATQTGAEAIVVSNHGGRQLDGALPSLWALPAIVSAVGRRVEVLMDGGIRSGQDVLKALALGARGVLIGRAFLYGLGADGESGVASCLNFIRRELDVSMALCGVTHVRAIDRSILLRGGASNYIDYVTLDK